ncbi:hypothetical_protein (plasmid) [Leishmania braziliensis MHOM/BR/75/M2904]|uniref:Hypothetical_protein n=1 Tax=Leishmania braziliensis MHOM/BR/75/M2904 TaxID=420245 RepID=A0A3P3Z6N2_LEIBR|nr:unnamed protein product [Leishmania braziliensis]CAJ2473363.1 unnamed protein product [Leishmania braziliensis]SYZ65893.1 hypothetical_protein [Leishmania braziliensis MHOM/BR/75/M2904]
MDELEVALREVHCGSAPGIDDNHCDRIKALPLRSRRAPLSIYNQSVATGCDSSTWKEGLAAPLLSSHTPEDDPASYRPVALTGNMRSYSSKWSRGDRAAVCTTNPSHSSLVSVLAAPS